MPVKMTVHQIRRIQQIHTLAAATYKDRPEDSAIGSTHAPPDSTSYSIAALTDTGNGTHELLRHNRLLKDAVVLEVNYLDDESHSTGDAQIAGIVVCADGTPLGAPPFAAHLAQEAA